MSEVWKTPEDKRRLRWFYVGLGTAVIVIAAFGSSTARAGDRTSGAYLPHPSTCPRVAFCGCGASVDLFGRPVRALYLAAAWLKFPRTSPAPNMVAARRGHVFVLKRHIQGNIWLAADYNSGGHKSRLHPRSIAGYTIVNPHTRVAMR